MTPPRTTRFSRPVVTFSPNPDEPATLQDAIRLMTEVSMGQRRLKLVIGNGVSKLPLGTPEQILTVLRRKCHDEWELLIDLLSGEFERKLRGRRYGQPQIRKLIGMLLRWYPPPQANRIMNAARGAGRLGRHIEDDLRKRAKEIDARCLDLGQRSVEFLETLWADYEVARFMTKQNPPVAFTLVTLLTAAGRVACIITPNYDCYLSTVLKHSRITFVQNPCLRHANQWNYDELLSRPPRPAADTLRIWKVFGDFDFARYSCGHIVRLPERMPVAPLNVPGPVQQAHDRIARIASTASDAPYCQPEDHDARFYGNDILMAYQPLHLVDFNWPARHRVFGEIIQGAKDDLERDPHESLILVLGYSGNRDPIGTRIQGLADDVPVIHIMAHSRKYPLLDGHTSQLWDDLEGRRLAFRLKDNMASGHRRGFNRNELMEPLATLLRGSGLASPQAIHNVHENWVRYWGDRP